MTREATSKSIKMYQLPNGVVPFTEWLNALEDLRGRQKILARLERLRLGNFGDHRFLGSGVIELKVDFGPGYRVYRGNVNESLVVLLLGGDKSTQDGDIKKANIFWEDYKTEKRYAER